MPLGTHSRIDDRLVAETSRRIADIRATAEAQEGLGAFLEKRKPAWVDSTMRPAKKSSRRKRATKKSARRQPVKRAR
jgi:hypothetical protein